MTKAGEAYRIYHGILKVNFVWEKGLIWCQVCCIEEHPCYLFSPTHLLAVDEQNAQTENQLSISSSSISTSMAALSHFTTHVPEQLEGEGDREQEGGMGESEGQEVEKGTLEQQGKIADPTCKKGASHSSLGYKLLQMCS